MSEANEPVSFAKWVSGFVKAATWAKTLVFLIIGAFIVGVPAGIWYFGHKAGYTKGHLDGYEAGLDWADKHPKQVVTGDGCTINNNVCPKVNKYGFQARGCTLGLVCSN